MLTVKRYCSDIILSFVFIAFFLIAYRDVIFYPKLIAGVDFQILSYTPYIHMLGFISSWLPQNLGFPAWGTNYGALLNALFVLLSDGNQVIAQKFAFSGILIASFTMYFFLMKYITKSRLAGFAGAIIYAYSPMTTNNFGTGIPFGVAFLPLVLNYMFNMFKTRAKIRDPILFALSLTLVYPFYSQFLLLMPLAILVPFLVNLLTKSRDMTRVGYVIHCLKYFTIGFSLFFAINFSDFYISIMHRSYRGLPLSQVDISYFFGEYSSFTFANAIRLAPLCSRVNPVQEYLQNQLIGFILPVLAFSSLLIARDSGIRKHVFGFSIIAFFLIIFGMSVQGAWEIFIWFYHCFPLIRSLRSAYSILLFLSFLYSSLIAVTVDELIWSISSSFAIKSKMVTLKLIKERPFLIKPNPIIRSMILMAIVLVSYFGYVPAYSPGIHALVPSFENPAAYESVVSWMRNHGEYGTFRFLLVPQSHTAGLNFWNTCPYIYGAGDNPLSSSYVLFTYDALIRNGSTHLGSLLAPANVKYVVVILNSTEASRLEVLVSGDVRRAGTAIVGEPEKFIDIFSDQKDLKPITYGDGYIIYENTKFIPHITFPSAASNIIGDRDALISMSHLPNFNMSHNLQIFTEQLTEHKERLLNSSSTLIFNERNFDDLLMSFLVKEFGLDLWQYGGSSSEETAGRWLRSTDVYPFFTYGEGYIETTFNSSMKVEFQCKSESEYEIWLRVLHSPSSRGTLMFSLDGTLLQNRILKPAAENSIGFKWVNLGSFLLSGVHTLTISNLRGYNALDELVVVPLYEKKEVETKILRYLVNKKIAFLYNSEKPFVNIHRLESESEYETCDSTTSWSKWNVAETLETDTVEKVEGNASLKWMIDLDIKEDIHHIVYDPPGAADWSNKDYLEIWVYGDNQNRWVCIQLRDDNGNWRNLKCVEQPHDSYTFNTNFSGWKHFVLSLTDYRKQGGEFNITKVDKIDIGYYPQQADMGNTIIRFDDIRLTGFLEKEFLVSIHIPKDDYYSIGLKAPPELNKDSIKVQIDNNTFSIQEKTSNWYESQPSFLNVGEHRISIILSEQVEPEKIVVFTGTRLSDLFNVQASSINYSVKKNSEVEYVIELKTDIPSFVVLSESYDLGWHAYISGKELLHFPAFSFTNGFYVNSNSRGTIIIKFEPQTLYITMISLSVGTIILLFAIILYDLRVKLFKSISGRVARAKEVKKVLKEILKNSNEK